MGDAGKEPHGAHQGERANVCVGEGVMESDRCGQNGPTAGDDVIYQEKMRRRLVRVRYGKRLIMLPHCWAVTAQSRRGFTNRLVATQT